MNPQYFISCKIFFWYLWSQNWLIIQVLMSHSISKRIKFMMHFFWKTRFWFKKQPILLKKCLKKIFEWKHYKDKDLVRILCFAVNSIPLIMKYFGFIDLFSTVLQYTFYVSLYSYNAYNIWIRFTSNRRYFNFDMGFTRITSFEKFCLLTSISGRWQWYRSQ